MKRPLLLLTLLHLVGNAALLGVGYWWLNVGESSAANLTLSITLLLIFVCGTAWLHGTSLAFFRESAPADARTIIGGPLRRLLPLVSLTILTVGLYFALTAWEPLNASRATDVASYLTLKSQSPVRPATVQRIFDAAWWILLWAIVPALLLPIASGVAALGWRGLREAGARWRSWLYWLAVPVLLSLAAWAPLQIVQWKPVRGAFGTEMASAIARFGLAYLLFVGACLALAFVTSRGKPSLNQPSTVDSL